MLLNYLRTASRLLLKNIVTTLINITGLSVAMTATLLILLWVNNELNFDRYHPQSDRIYRITCITDNPDNQNKQVLEYSPLLLSDFAKNNIPEVTGSGRLFTSNWSIPVLKVNNELFAEKNYAYVDSGWFDVFRYDFIDGTVADLYQSPFSIALTSSKAKTYFKDQDPIGKVIRIDSVNYTVKAVLRDNPSNSSFLFDILIPLEAYLANPNQRRNEENWNIYNYMTFVRLKPNSDVNLVGQKLSSLLAGNSKNKKNVACLEPLKDLHFEAGLPSSPLVHGNKTYVYIFGTLGFILLLIACINYNNLTTAQASRRGKEIGIRKIVGASKRDIFAQLFIQSMLVCVISLIIAVFLVRLMIPLFNQTTDKHFVFNLLSLDLWKVLGSTAVAAILLSCIYPSVLLSSFHPLNVIKGIGFLKFSDVNFRKALLIVQFTFSMVLFIATLIINRQLSYISRNDLAYDRSQVFAVSLPISAYLTSDDAKRKSVLEYFRRRLSSQSSISEVAIGGHSIIDVRSSQVDDVEWQGKSKTYHPTLAQLNVDDQFKNVFDLSMTEGNWFGAANPAGQHYFILNETAVREFGLREPVIQQKFILKGDTGQIIGVVKDFHFQSFHERMLPLVFYNNPTRRLKVFVKASPGKIDEAVSAAKAAWKSELPGIPFDISFMDKEFESLYRNEQTASRLILSFSIVTIVTSMLGLLGLAILMVEEKTKEIGIRKILGASVAGIVRMLSWDFLRLIGVALVIASPIAAWVMNKWLQGFAYRIPIRWWMFGMAGGMAMLIAACTIGSQAIRAAMANPIRTLRSE